MSKKKNLIDSVIESYTGGKRIDYLTELCLFVCVYIENLYSYSYHLPLKMFSDCSFHAETLSYFVPESF